MIRHGDDPAARLFAPFTDPAALAPLLTAPVRSLWGRPLEILECEVAHAWRKTFARESAWPKSFLRVCYRVRLAGPRGQSPFPAWLHGLAQIESQTPAAPAPDARVATVRAGGACLVLRRFPDDPALPQLDELTTPRTVADCLRQAGLAGPGDEVSAVDILRYRPGERCAMRVGLAAREPWGERRYFAKTYRDDTGALAYWRLRQLDVSAGLVARPLRYDARLRTVWQAWIDGERADQAADRETAVRFVVRSLAALHGSGATPGALATREALRHDSGKRATKLSRAHPGLARMLDATVDACDRRMPALPVERAVPVHGDVHLEQFLLVANGAVMVDLDELREGEPEQDLAALLVDLRLRDDGAPWHGRLAGLYRAAGSEPIRPDVLRWYLCLQCIDKAYRIHWKGVAALEPLVGRLVGWASELAHATTLEDCDRW